MHRNLAHRLLYMYIEWYSNANDSAKRVLHHEWLMMNITRRENHPLSPCAKSTGV